MNESHCPARKSKVNRKTRKLFIYCYDVHQFHCFCSSEHRYGNPSTRRYTLLTPCLHLLSIARAIDDGNKRPRTITSSPIRRARKPTERQHLTRCAATLAKPTSLSAFTNNSVKSMTLIEQNKLISERIWIRNRMYLLPVHECRLVVFRM